MSENKTVYLVDGCRSPIGRGHPEKGIYHDLRADDLAVQVLQALVNRVGLDAHLVDDLFLGCVGQHLEQGKNIARLIGLMAGLGDSVPGVTFNRLCGSSMTALHLAADSIRAGTNSLVVVGGVEHMGHVPMTAAVDYHPNLFNNYDFKWNNMGLTAERLAEDFKISREEQDSFTIESNNRYFQVREAGFYGREIVPIRLANLTKVTDDEEPRESTLEKLALLKTPFKETGTVTAANSSGISDGACMAVVCDEERLDVLGKKPLTKLVTTTTIGLDPTIMGLGPVHAIRKLLDRTGHSISDIDLFEINEAFAVQVLACQQTLGIDSDRLNIHGGAVALGHPLGMSGLRLAVTLSHSLAESGAKLGIASLCVGHGQGVAMLLERD